MDEIVRNGMDTSKNVFQLHGVNEAEEPILRRRLRRAQMISFMSRVSPTIVGIEAGGAAHYWARTFAAMSHEVRIMAPQFVKPYVKRDKNDAADPEALCEAMNRPTMRFVPAKTAEQQAALMLVSIRDRLVRTRTRLTNAIRDTLPSSVSSPAPESVKAPRLSNVFPKTRACPTSRGHCSRSREMNWQTSKHASRRSIPNSLRVIAKTNYPRDSPRFLASVPSAQQCSR